jgi:hypothetical protein
MRGFMFVGLLGCCICSWNSPAFPKIVSQLDWPMDQVAKKFPKLLCRTSKIIMCSEHELLCGAPTSLVSGGMGFEVDMQNQRLRFDLADESLEFSKVESSINERGFDGTVAMIGQVGSVSISVLEPTDPLTSIEFSFVARNENGWRQALIGTCSSE